MSKSIQSLDTVFFCWFLLVRETAGHPYSKGLLSKNLVKCGKKWHTFKYTNSCCNGLRQVEKVHLCKLVVAGRCKFLGDLSVFESCFKSCYPVVI